MNTIQRRRAARERQSKKRNQGSTVTALENTRIVAAWLAGSISPEEARQAMGMSPTAAHELRQSVVRAGKATVQELLEGRK